MTSMERVSGGILEVNGRDKWMTTAIHGSDYQFTVRRQNDICNVSEILTMLRHILVQNGFSKRSAEQKERSFLS